MNCYDKIEIPRCCSRFSIFYIFMRENLMAFLILEEFPYMQMLSIQSFALSPLPRLHMDNKHNTSIIQLFWFWLLGQGVHIWGNKNHSALE